jgi:preprotein translocase subunit SecD
VGVVVGAIYLGVFLGPSNTPALGLDLRGGTEVTLTAQPIGGGSVSRGEIDQAIAIIRDRVNGLGVAGASITRQGNDHIVVQVPGKGRDQVANQVGQTALLRFRQAMSILNYSPTVVPTTSASASASPSTSASPKATSSAKAHAKTSGSPKAKASKTSSSSGDALSSVLLHPKAAVTASTTPTTSPTTSPTVSPTTTPAGSPSPATSASPTASAAGASATSVPLPGSQSPTVTKAFVTSFENWDCAKNPNPTNGADNPNWYIIACDSPKSPSAKYLLAPAAVEGQQVHSASANVDNTGKWVVNLTFNGSGTSAWQKVTAAAYKVNNGLPQSTACSYPTGCNSVAIVLDGVVVSAPYISQAGGIPGGQAEISGSFTDSTANSLANTLKYGALPLKFTQSSVSSVSATLGNQQLRGGLIAGAIGLGLVILFSLLYYRALGLVTVGSLFVSGLILYGVTTLLGHSSVGYTLSLPGIAGFIVAVGITADSFVVFFERLRDEVREGRRLRSAVERAWPRARRTIVSADFISLLAAFVLYTVSIGDVRGFAFTLGLSTLSDLFIVFFFTYPLLELLARVDAFDSGKSWTGIGKARMGVKRDPAEADSRPLRSQEA